MDTPHVFNKVFSSQLNKAFIFLDLFKFLSKKLKPASSASGPEDLLTGKTKQLETK